MTPAKEVPPIHRQNPFLTAQPAPGAEDHSSLLEMEEDDVIISKLDFDGFNDFC